MVMKQKLALFVSLWLAVSLINACRTSMITPTQITAPTTTFQAKATATQKQSVATPSLTASPQVEPTRTPLPESEVVVLDELPIGQPGHYVNLAFGFWIQYPTAWYTGFGNRPLVASFSNLDPGTQNRHSMRLEGCLIEVSVSTNIFGFTPHQVVSQLARSLPNAEPFELSGEPAMYTEPTGEGLFESAVIVVAHEDRLFSITLEHATGAAETCRPAWENLLRTWQWLEPDFVAYRNTRYGYAVSYPRQWYRFDAREEGVAISSLDPTGMSQPELLREGMLVRTDVHENPQDLTLREWLADQDWNIDSTHEMPLDGLVGVRVLREGPSADVQQMSGYFLGPLGRIYEVTCLYPQARQEEFQCTANAILYGFSF